MDERSGVYYVPPDIQDRTITDLVEESHGHDVLGKTANKYIADPLRSIAAQKYDRQRLSGLVYGVIVYTAPHRNWYKVQLHGSGGVMQCTALNHGSNLSIGVRQTNFYPPYTQVLVYLFPSENYGLIVGAISDRLNKRSRTHPDMIAQDGRSGFFYEGCYTFPIEGLFRGGGIEDFSSARPTDATSLEYGWLSSTGIGLHIDDFQAFLRVNEMCGLFLNYFDSHTRLAGLAMDIVSASHELVVRNDEGELQLFEGHAVYPWEAVGVMTNSVPGSEDFGEDVKERAKFARGRVDLPFGQEDLQPFYRHRKYGGYLGQGRRSQVVVPSSISGIRQYTQGAGSAEAPDIGVFDESVSLDGGYLLRSAKQILFQKTILIPAAKQQQLPEAQTAETSDNAENYRASGTFGGGPEHKVKALVSEEANTTKHFQKAAGLQDAIANAVWKADHPFHYHENDYYIPNASDLADRRLGPAQEQLNFNHLLSDASLEHPEAVEVEVDQRYQTVEYFRCQATFAMLDDGSVVLEDGYGSQILMSAGHIKFSCPGDVQLNPGRAVIAQGSDVIIKAHDSVDISASNKDVRIKADKNMQLLAGNSGVGGILLESKADADYQEYEQKYGEDVNSSGIVLKSEHAGIRTYSYSLYCRTGIGKSSGDITFDANQGNNSIVMKSQWLLTYLARGVQHAIGPRGEEANNLTVVAFTDNTCLLPANTLIAGSITAMGEAVFRGSCQIEGKFATKENQSQIFRTGPDFPDFLTKVEKSFSEAKDEAKTVHKNYFVNYVYAPKGPGNQKLVSQIQFSYRDDPEQKQYNAKKFEFVESRWQQMVRLGEAYGGSGWTENSVTYQGAELMPWPGKTNWTGDTFVQLEALSLYDSAAGHAKDRGKDYEDPKYGTVEKVPLDQNFTIITN